jgi:hypothetical protein
MHHTDPRYMARMISQLQYHQGMITYLDLPLS